MHKCINPRDSRGSRQLGYNLDELDKGAYIGFQKHVRPSVHLYISICLVSSYMPSNIPRNPEILHILRDL